MIKQLQAAVARVFPWWPASERGPVGRAGALPWAPFVALLPGAVLGGLHHWLPRRFGIVPPSLEALVLLLAYAALGGLAPLRALGAAATGKDARTGAAASALVVVLGVLVLREALSVVVSLRTDISFPGARLVAAWPVVGHWSALLAAQLLPQGEGASVAPAPPSGAGFLLASGALLVLFFAAFPPGFFLFVVPAIVVGAAGAYPIGRARDGDAALHAGAAAGIAEIVFVIGAAVATLRY